MSYKLNKNLSPEWEVIAEIYNEVKESTQQQGLNKRSAEQCAIISAELVENAVQYQNSKNITDQILYSLTIFPSRIEVEVKSSYSSDDEDSLDLLDDLIQWVRGYQNFMEPYSDALKKLFYDMNTNAPLGIVRSAYHSRSDLDFYLDDDERISISAVITH